MIRSRSNEATRTITNEVYHPARQTLYRREIGSEIDSLAKEHRDLVFWLLKEALRSYAVITKRLSWILLISSTLLISLAFITVMLRSGTGFSSPLLQFLFLLNVVLAGLLLFSTCGLALYGSAYTIHPGPSLSIPGEDVSRQKVLNQAQVEIKTVRQAEQKARAALRWTAVFLIASLLIYLFMIVLFVL